VHEDQNFKKDSEKVKPVGSFNRYCVDVYLPVSISDVAWGRRS